MTPVQLQRLALILSRLLVLDAGIPAPDAQDLREVSRMVLEEQLRELRCDAKDIDELVRRLRQLPEDPTQ